MENSPSPVFYDSLDNVISGETVPTIDGPEYPPLLWFLIEENITYYIQPGKDKEPCQSLLMIKSQPQANPQSNF